MRKAAGLREGPLTGRGGEALREGSLLGLAPYGKASYGKGALTGRPLREGSLRGGLLREDPLRETPPLRVLTNPFTEKDYGKGPYEKASYRKGALTGREPTRIGGEFPLVCRRPKKAVSSSGWAVSGPSALQGTFPLTGGPYGQTAWGPLWEGWGPLQEPLTKSYDGLLRVPSQRRTTKRLTGRLDLYEGPRGGLLQEHPETLLREVLMSPFTKKDDEKAYGKLRPFPLMGPLREDPLRGRLLTGRLGPYEKAPYGEGRSSLTGGGPYAEGPYEALRGRLLTRRLGPYEKGPLPYGEGRFLREGSFLGLALSLMGVVRGGGRCGEGSLREG